VTRVLVVGDVMLDRDLYGSVGRVAPDAPVPVVELDRRAERPGGAGLAAVMAADLAGDGAGVALATCLGDDANGRRVRELLRGVDVVELATVPATRGVTRIRSGGQALLRVDEAGTAVTPDVGVDLGALERAVAAADAVHVADYGAGVASHPAVREVLGRWVDRRPIVWDPHPRGGDPLPGATVATPNRAEVGHALAKHGLTPATPGLEAAAEALRERWDVGAVAATDGGTGVFVAPAGSPPLFTPTPGDVPGDTCGAGDRFAAAVTAALGRGTDLVTAVGAAVTDVGEWLAAGGVATLSTSSTGERVAATHSPGERAGATRSPDEPALPAEVAAVRRRGGTVVATGGCFDVLHAGHVASLQAARRLGDCLVVLLNSDDSVRRLKGPGRPVHGVADRCRVLESLECVDAVIVFDGDDPGEALARLRPDVWAKGGDYAGARLPEADLLRGWGGRLVLLPYLPNRSTTRILAHAAVRPRPAEGLQQREAT
jgi:D-beta-D-heptose 7-phosphate kinase/D-beta-D-heptose 1-phosphate adenosyltransferase